jgi:hypothetical protein
MEWLLLSLENPPFAMFACTIMSETWKMNKAPL